MNRRLEQGGNDSSTESHSHSGTNWSDVLERSGKGRKSDEFSSHSDMDFSWVSTSWDFGRSDPPKSRLRVGLEQGKILIVESEQFVSATFPSDLRKGKKRRKFPATT